jgi:hypothetical protein
MPRARSGSIPGSILMTSCVLLLAAGQAGAAGQPITLQSRDLVQAAAAAPVGGALRLENVQVAETGEAATFALERFQVFADDAEITLHGDGGRTTVLPAPKNTYFRGTVEGEPGSRVFLTVLAGGATQGIVSRGGESYLIGGDGADIRDLGNGAPAKALGGPLEMRRIDPLMLKAAKGEGFACGDEQLPQRPQPFEALTLAGGGEAPVAKAATGALPGFTARVAIETDFEFYALFNNATNATNYIGNLLGYSSTIYTNELNTSLMVQSVSLWTTSSDPWTQTGSTLCGLMEFGRYWNLNHTGTPRTIAHFMSGKGLGGGIAWIGVLCSGGFSTSANCPGIPTDANWGGGYGFTASLTGQFDVNHPTVMWDIVAVSHEIGHNFNSPHTHCYNGLDGNASPIDQCRSGESDGHGACYSGSQVLPGPAGSGSGTIMSYCHLLSGGYGNITLNFGTGHPFGVAPGREAARMSSFVVSSAASNPSCLAFTSGSSAIFTNGFESGVLPGAWSGKAP